MELRFLKDVGSSTFRYTRYIIITIFAMLVAVVLVWPVLFLVGFKHAKRSDIINLTDKR